VLSVIFDQKVSQEAVTASYSLATILKKWFPKNGKAMGGYRRWV
jgi:hypothetical protein